jgi:hypothetical protein
MIIGIGSDITDVRRIAKVIDRHGERFIDRIFTPTERAKAEKRRNRVETYAKRFAAKEACAKALGTGFRAGVWWRTTWCVDTVRLAGSNSPAAPAPLGPIRAREPGAPRPLPSDDPGYAFMVIRSGGPPMRAGPYLARKVVRTALRAAAMKIHHASAPELSS